MTQDNLFSILFNLLPALIVAMVAIFFFSTYIKSQETRQRFIIRRQNRKDSLPARLQAYERMTLFLERIKLTSLVVRIKPTTTDRVAYERMLAQSIENEYEHNISQQIYISQECWDVITAAKNATIQKIREVGMHEKTNSVDRFREHILSENMEGSVPSSVAIAFLKEELKSIF